MDHDATRPHRTQQTPMTCSCPEATHEGGCVVGHVEQLERRVFSLEHLLAGVGAVLDPATLLGGAG